MDIFLTNSGFHLSGVPCTAVYDEKESISDSHVISPYRCGLKFEQVNEEQQNKLEVFLNNYTTGNYKGQRSEVRGQRADG